jgi:cell shape-determining protein MreD
VIRYCLSLLILILLAIIAQQFLPAFIGLYNARVFVLLVVFLCIAVSVPMPVMFLFALICGFIWDAQCSLGSPEVDATVYTNPVPSLRFGVSILLFGLVGMLMHGFRPLFLQGKWYLSALLTGIATFLYCLGEYSLLDFFRGSFTIGRGVLLQCSYTALLTTLISPVIFALLFLIAHIFNHSIVEQKKKTQYFYT